MPAFSFKMMRLFSCLFLTATLVGSLKFDAKQLSYNLNQNRTAVDPLDYWGEWKDHKFHESPSNWRFPFYTLFLDRFVNGDPSNDDANGTVFEYDFSNNQLRHGGDLAGLVDTLDYIQGMGIKGIYIAGSPFENAPWKADSYSPLDMTLLDRHFGDIAEWRSAITEIHKRGMYVILDNTMATMGDLIGFNGFLNITAPFTPGEHKAIWKSQRRYLDFDFDNTYKETCDYPRFWNESGFRVLPELDAEFGQLKGCYDSEFDQYGDLEAFGEFPDWKRQLSKFASVQDRLREWVPSVREKIQLFSCITIAMLDIDGFRFDKALQVTVDAQAEFGEYIRDCARRYGKHNFFMPGEITGGNTIGSIYLGRGRQPDMLPENLTRAVTLMNTSNDKYFLRDEGKNALDAAAFHYSIYRSLTRFLGLSGNLTAGYDVPINFVDTWNTMLTTNDLVNPSTGKFDPRHMYGVTNQDVFRWPAIKNGTQRMLLGLFITTLEMPGIPLLLWGEEQAFYVLDNTAENYVFGRQPISSALAWQNHGCYRLGSSIYDDFPVDSAANGCHDDSVSLDHRDPSHPVRNIIKSMYHIRRNYRVLNDGYFLQSLSNQTHDIVLPGSNGTATETGMWSVLRDQFLDVQNFTGSTEKQKVWLVYQNDDHTINYRFDCSSNESALISPFDEGTTIKNLFPPYEEIKLKSSPKKLGIEGSEEFNGCLDHLELDAWGFKAYVPKKNWIDPQPMLTKFLPGHDARLKITDRTAKTTVDIEFQFSEAMKCSQITQNLRIDSTTEENVNAKLDKSSVSCSKLSDPDPIAYVGGVQSAWRWKGKLQDVASGVHSVTLNNLSTSDGERFTGSVDHLMFRIGTTDNPIVFPRLANYSQDTLSQQPNGDLSVTHKASGADKWRYSLNWGSSWSEWFTYHGGNSTLAIQPWTGTGRQKWEGEHVILHYWNRMTGSSDALQHADADWTKPPRRFPHLFAQGPFNQFGFDSGIKNDFQQDSDGLWKFHLMTEWPSQIQVNVWGMNPDGQPDKSFVFGDLDNDSVLDRLPPDFLGQVVVNLTELPPSPFLAYQIALSDSNNSFRLLYAGNRLQQILLFALLWSIPILTGAVSIWIYMGAFYSVKFNKIGAAAKGGLFSFRSRRGFQKVASDEDRISRPRFKLSNLWLGSPHVVPSTLVPTGGEKRRTVLIATMEYDIEDWAIKIKIGGLGVMAQLMGKNLSHQDLIWVVPCVGDVDYPTDQPAETMTITILGSDFEVQVQYHKLRNITYVLLDAPVFRKQTKSEPYPPRMDDLDSAIYYSAWNACIAEAIKRFPVDLYHINDYHGAAAPLYLLPRTIPCCLSLHNAEFQGLWPMRTTEEQEEVSKVFNLTQPIIQSYVQFGEVFNLLHAGASYLRVHQKGFGAVGVSSKYGRRSYARYPIFWGLKEIGQLPNPDPTDTDAWDQEKEANQSKIAIDPLFEASRGELRRQAQEWAQLDVDPNAELFVFVGRWSNQKGVDLIADVFPAILENHSSVQLICIGPVIDLYGKFAALKLGEMMKRYPRRVFSKPEFTTLPPYIFTGAEFALIPSRDEPFGLVAVEFGRKGALGVGARVGGLGQMPGWWFTVESTTTKHLQRQFKSAIEEALSSDTRTRAMMRARSAKQRFPVAKWIIELDQLQSTSIKMHDEQARRHSGISLPLPPLTFQEVLSQNSHTGMVNPFDTDSSRQNTPPESGMPSSGGLSRTMSLGVHRGPGHITRINRPDADIVDSVTETMEFDDEMRESGHSGEYTMSHEEAEVILRAEHRRQALHALTEERQAPFPEASTETLAVPRGRGRPQMSSEPRLDVRSRSVASVSESLLAVPQPTTGGRTRSRASSVLSLHEVIGSKSDYKLQQVDPTFNDTNGDFYREFETKLNRLSGKTSENELSVELFLVESEKLWFKKMRNAKLGRSRSPSPNPSIQSRASLSLHSISDRDPSDEEPWTPLHRQSTAEEFLLGADYRRPSFLKRIMQIRIGDWPIYSLLLALGQIIAANSYQITLLTGGQGETPLKLYVLGSIYIATSCIWWIIFRTLNSRVILSVPFLFYGLSFLIVGISPFVPSGGGRDWVHNIAAGIYITASSSGSIFFALNFGDEGGAPIKSWVWRACMIQGTQVIYITALFYWGSTMMNQDSNDPTSISSKPIMAAITIPIAALLFAVGIVLFTSLPPYYRQSPGKIPNFYLSIFRRRIVGWLFVTVVLQNYWLSTPYGRNWAYLWSSQTAPAWAVGLLVLVFFVFIWVVLLMLFSRLSKTHSWILPIFAIGLGAPRWAQMLWGTSGIGLWLPWMPGGPVAGALAGRTLWLWLGVLDAIQGVGFGMILLQTLTRMHMAVSLVAAQIIGTAVTILAKGTAPDKDGPGDVFPDFSAGVIEGLSKPWFWVALACQLVIPIGFFKFFRKEQLRKP